MNEHKPYEVESSTLFSESLIWQLNRDYYQETGIEAWSDGVVPHNICLLYTSPSPRDATLGNLRVSVLKILQK